MKTFFRYYKKNAKGGFAFTGWYEDTPGNRAAWEKTDKQGMKKQVAKVNHFVDLSTTPLFTKLLREMMEDKDA